MYTFNISTIGTWISNIPYLDNVTDAPPNGTCCSRPNNVENPLPTTVAASSIGRKHAPVSCHLYSSRRRCGNRKHADTHCTVYSANSRHGRAWCTLPPWSPDSVDAWNNLHRDIATNRYRATLNRHPGTLSTRSPYHRSKVYTEVQQRAVY